MTDHDDDKYVKVIEDGGYVSNTANVFTNAMASPSRTLLMENKGDGKTTPLAAPTYNFILWVFAGVLAFCLIAILVLAMTADNPSTEVQKEAVSMFKEGFKLLLATFVGLLGGKNL